MEVTTSTIEMMKVAAPPMALQRQPILSLSCDLWTDVWHSRQHLLSRISRENPVLYVTDPFHVRDAVKGLWSTDRMSTGLSRVTDTLYTYVPPRWLPYNYRLPWLNRTTSKLRIKQIREALDKLEMRQPVMYMWHPSFADMLGQFDESLVVYHCYDEYYDFPGISATDRMEIQRQEDAILGRADIVFAASSSIYERKLRLNPNTYIMRNGVNYPLFATAQEAQTEVPEDLQRIPRPVIGCVTRIVDDYFDLHLMRQVFTRRPDWSLAVVGPEDTRSSDKKQELEALKNLPNVYLLGRREQAKVPAYLKGFDVCLIAYPLIDVVLHTESPLKMMEYLAAGKPIVSPQLPLLSYLDEVIYFAHGVDGWIAAIEQALKENTAEKIERRQAVGRENSWDHKAAFIAGKLAGELARRQGSGLHEQHNG
jgi:glycosyltransferase involved in cell wall biosynthesis